MLEITHEQIVKILAKIGIGYGDGLLVHSALQFLGRPVGGVETYYTALSTVLDGEIEKPIHALTHGTIAVPAFNFAFASGERYDPAGTPSVGMGAFSEYVRSLPDSMRTTHPLQSLAVVGLHAADLAGRDTSSAFDPGSAFERMLELDFKLLLLGADIQSVSLLHYSEQRAQVPYRYWKDFNGDVRFQSGWETRTYRMFVRDLELDPQIELYPVQELLEKRKQWSSISLNYGYISTCRLVNFVAAIDELLAVDPWSLVVNRPQDT